MCITYKNTFMLIISSVLYTLSLSKAIYKPHCKAVADLHMTACVNTVVHELTNAMNNKHQVCYISRTVGLAALCVVTTVQRSGMDTS